MKEGQLKLTRKSKEKWKQIWSEWRQSGETQSIFCKQRSVSFAVLIIGEKSLMTIYFRNCFMIFSCHHKVKHEPNNKG